MERSPRSPTSFVVARHLLHHPNDSPTRLARHCNLNVSPASRALRRLVQETGLRERLLVEAMRTAREKPRWLTFPFRAPNPYQWVLAVDFPHWLSGERAADEIDDIDLASDRRIEYVQETDLEAALSAVTRIGGKSCAPKDANLTIRVADPWMDLSGAAAEKGQRWYDYVTSSNIQLSGWRP